MSTLPLIACICPTYKRPTMLQNSLALFLKQDYPNKLMIICDDAGQFPNQEGQDWYLYSSEERFDSLPVKYNDLADKAIKAGADILIPWEDDDIYLSNHLSSIARVWRNITITDEDRTTRELTERTVNSYQFFVSSHIWSNYNQPFGKLIKESAHGRFHSSWAFTTSLFMAVDGYPVSTRLTFDQEMRQRLLAGGRDKNGKITCEGETLYAENEPTVVYRWGRRDTYNGSSQSGAHYNMLWEELGRRPFDRITNLVPIIDGETRAILDNFRREQ